MLRRTIWHENHHLFVTLLAAWVLDAVSVVTGSALRIPGILDGCRKLVQAALGQVDVERVLVATMINYLF